MKRWAKLAGNTEVGLASQIVVAGQLAKLRQYADKLQKGDSDDVEAIHQLRVYCRRIQATIDVLGEFLPAKHASKLAKRTKRLRQAAGKVRDWDVLSIDLQTLHLESSEQERLAIENLQSRYTKHRARCRKKLSVRLDKLDRRDFWKWVDAHYSINEPASDPPAAESDEVSLVEVAQTKLHEALDTYLVTFTEQGVGSTRELHVLRLATKRFRYTLDVFGSCFTKEAFREVYTPVKQLQDDLGIINDAAQFAERFAARRGKEKNAEMNNSLLVLEERYLSEQAARIQAFRDAWPTDARDAYADQFRRLLDLKSKPAAEPPSHLAANSSPE